MCQRRLAAALLSVILLFGCSFVPAAAAEPSNCDAVIARSTECTSGSIYKSIKIDEADRYTLAIRNNASYAVTVTGTVRY